MSIRIFLDDERPAPNGWTLCRWPQDVIDLLQANPENVEVVSRWTMTSATKRAMATKSFSGSKRLLSPKAIARPSYACIAPIVLRPKR
jgi:hypothetical protein